MLAHDFTQTFRGTVFVSACEPSADTYAALFINQLKTRQPALKIVGIGGPEMKAAGVELLDDFRGLMTFGLSAAAENARSDWSIYRMIARALYKTRPDVFMPVAYPGINLLLCRYARSLGIRTIYLLPPQIWAWGNFRKYFIKKWVDQVISFFPFEYEYYKRLRIPAIYFENPLKNGLKSYRRTDFKKRVGFMPGSRPQEIKRNFPVILNLIAKLKDKKNVLQFSIILREKSDLPQTLHSTVFKVFNDRYQAMKNCDLIVTCSGTASLETAFLNIPQVFFNRPSWIDYNIMRRLVTIKEYNLTNLYLQRKTVPSFIDRDLNKLCRAIQEEIYKTLNYSVDKSDPPDKLKIEC